MSEPTVITLNAKNAVDILIKYIELGQSKGAFKKLQDAYLFKRAFDVLLHHTEDKEITVDSALSMLSQGVNMIQGSGGVFTINDAADIFTILQFLSVDENKTDLYTKSEETQVLGDSLEYETTPEPTITPVAESTPVEESQAEKTDEFDLSELSQPVPLKISHV